MKFSILTYITLLSFLLISTAHTHITYKPITTKDNTWLRVAQLEIAEVSFDQLLITSCFSQLRKKCQSNPCCFHIHHLSINTLQQSSRVCWSVGAHTQYCIMSNLAPIMKNFFCMGAGLGRTASFWCSPALNSREYHLHTSPTPPQNNYEFWS